MRENLFLFFKLEGKCSRGTLYTSNSSHSDIIKGNIHYHLWGKELFRNKLTSICSFILGGWVSCMVFAWKCFRSNICKVSYDLTLFVLTAFAMTLSFILLNLRIRLFPCSNNDNTGSNKQWQFFIFPLDLIVFTFHSIWASFLNFTKIFYIFKSCRMFWKAWGEKKNVVFYSHFGKSFVFLMLLLLTAIHHSLLRYG